MQWAVRPCGVQKKTSSCSSVDYRTDEQKLLKEEPL
ncbi:hypothetical protein BACCAP_00368 [Pseudoflavonifractor capillosus ATCC 29799]|uniref:Uncharacterized protein n=1 Tax=Pseudoflavonifractor capillosus ATCC 29799 TaxID=411467 RepID=A6NQ98_9FIRM|nr:hypothetical protein BACCAP_00368 [Pseudoflavonifractor capillosus ATCC 29799]